MNMKKMKRLVALALSVVMVLAMSVVAFAEGNGENTAQNSITIENASVVGHTYEAYQIFAGDLSEGTLSNITWGTGVNTTKDGQTLLRADEAKTKAESLKTADDAKTFAQQIAPYLSAAKYTSTTTEENPGKYVINNLPAGYYLVKDKDNSLSSKDDFYTAYIMKVVGNVTAEPKGEKPSVEKKVEENTKYDSDGGYGKKYNDVADYNIGSKVPFKLIGSIPDMSRYDTYKYNFVDTLSAGLDLEADTVKVYVSSDKQGTNKKEISNTEYRLEETASPKGFKVQFTDLKKVDLKVVKDEQSVDGKYIIVEYKATLNNDAVVGLPGNPNEVYLEYSNNPNQGGNGDTGKTPEDKVIVFTYKLDVTKVDATDNNTKLENAEFKLHNAAGKWATVNTEGRITGWVDSETDGAILKSNAQGHFEVIGLDHGTYYLKETKAPAQYNILANEVEFVINATTSNVQDWAGEADKALTAIEIKVGENTTTGNKEQGSVGITVENKKGSQLPSTGGIGTTIFYVVGGILMVGAAVLLITKRRAEN